MDMLPLVIMVIFLSIAFAVMVDELIFTRKIHRNGTEHLYRKRFGRRPILRSKWIAQDAERDPNIRLS